MLVCLIMYITKWIKTERRGSNWKLLQLQYVKFFQFMKISTGLINTNVQIWHMHACLFKQIHTLFEYVQYLCNLCVQSEEQWLTLISTSCWISLRASCASSRQWQEDVTRYGDSVPPHVLCLSVSAWTVWNILLNDKNMALAFLKMWSINQ